MKNLIYILILITILSCQGKNSKKTVDIVDTNQIDNVKKKERKIN